MPRMVEIQPVAGRNLRALRTDGKARRTFVLRALFTLAAIYSRSLLQQAQAAAELRSSVDGSRDGMRDLPIYGPVNGWLFWIAPPENECVLPPRGKAACAILNPRQRVAACSPGWSRASGVTRG